MIGVRLNEVLKPTVMDYSFFIYETQIRQSIQMSFCRCFFVILNSSSNFSISIGIQPIKILLKIKCSFFQILANSV